MNVTELAIPGVLMIEHPVHRDARGVFQKTYNLDMFREMDLNFQPRESFITTSAAGVIRGMHFQLPPMDHGKLVACPKGRALDVIMDIRKGSATYGTAVSVEFRENDGKSVFIPKGCAHGFAALEDDVIMVYYVETGYDRDCDCGILWNSIDFKWPFDRPIVSDRDSLLKDLKIFESPF